MSATANEKPFQPAERAEARLSVGQRRGLSSILNLNEFRDRARTILPKAIYGYVENGSEYEVSLETNHATFRNYRLVPRVLQDIRDRDQSVSLFGRTSATPFGIPQCVARLRSRLTATCNAASHGI